MRIPPEPVIHLLHEAPFGTLASHSTQLPGYPYATVVPNVLDERHCPLLLISALAEHTKNLLADPRVSLSLVEGGARNVQNAARLTLVGDAECFVPAEATAARYLRYQPDAAQYLGLDFLFFRVRPQRVRFIAGVGRMGWLEAGDWDALSVLDAAAEEALLAELADQVPASVRLLGIDDFGIDCEVDGVRRRSSFDSGPRGADELAERARRQLRTLANS